MDCFNAIPFTNSQSKLARPVKNHIRDIHGLVLCVKRSSDVGKLEKLFDGREYGCYWVLGMVGRPLDNVFALEELVGHQLSVVFLEVIQHIRHGVFD